MVVYESAGDTKYQHSLPTVSFREIPGAHGPFGVSSDQLKSYGFNDGSEFEQPREYIRYIEPIEKELAGQVEYDMDEQDRAWLDVINLERKKEQSGLISEEVFEIIIDKLEKEWFDLIKQIPQPPSHLPVEDSKCSICDDGEGENSNAIVFCDGCNLAVHQDCYGVPYIPEGQWLCRKCTVSPENPVSCLFCPNEGGAFKQTTTGHWAHLLCAMWIPELGVGNAIYMEPVEGVETVPKNRWKLNCSLCREKVGACIQCDNRSCFTAFHVTCARQMGLLQSMKSLSTTGTLRAYCDKHMPAESRSEYTEDGTASNFSEPAQERKTARLGPRGSHAGAANVTTKSARAHAKSYRPGPPIVPRYIVKHILDYIAKLSIRKREPLVERICRYWSLKREARRGAPLLKRLHLEPWTASNASKQQTEAEKAQKLKFLTILRNDLERVRMLSELVRKREREKLRQIEVIRNLVDDFIFPHNAKLRLALEKISAMDRTDVFKVPVNKTEVPDYYDVIAEPMCWTWIDEKIEQNQYRKLADFKHDILLTLDNAMKYNKADSTIFRVASRIRLNAEPILMELEGVAGARLTDGDDGESVGDLEPTDALLHALLSASDSNTEVDVLSSIFGFALEAPRPPTPPPPTPPPKESDHARRKRRQEEREAAYRERLAHGRSTRGLRAAEQDFNREAGIEDNRPSAATTPARARQAEKHADTGDRGRDRRPQKGVVAVESFAVVSDKERREIERGMGLTVDEVDEKQQLLRFNVGWVLPEGTKRHRSGPSASVTPTVLTKPLPHSVKADSAQPSGQDDQPGPSNRKRPAATSPATKRKKPAKRSRTAPQVKDFELEPADGSDGDLTSLEDATPDTEHAAPGPSRGPSEIIVGAPLAPKSESKSVPEKEMDDIYPPGTIVWAKSSTFPYFPAEVVDLEEDGAQIAPIVFAKQPSEEEEAAKGRSWLVRFYDTQSTYAWLREDKLEMLGEENAIDEKYLNGRDRNGRGNFKGSSQKASVRTAFRKAMAEMANSEDEA